MQRGSWVRSQHGTPSAMRAGRRSAGSGRLSTVALPGCAGLECGRSSWQLRGVAAPRRHAPQPAGKPMTPQNLIDCALLRCAHEGQDEILCVSRHAATSACSVWCSAAPEGPCAATSGFRPAGSEPVLKQCTPWKLSHVVRFHIVSKVPACDSSYCNMFWNTCSIVGWICVHRSE
jgi:hypothetical protein